MCNYLKILLIILPFIILNCSKIDKENDSIDYATTENGQINGNKYQQLYDSIYIRIALQKSLNDEALELFIKDIKIIKDLNLYSKISEIALDSYKYNDAHTIARQWSKIDPNSSYPFELGFRVSLELKDFIKAEYYLEKYLDIEKPKSKRDYSKLLFSLLENKNRLNVINFFDNYIEKNNHRELIISYIELLYSYNKPIKVIKNIDNIGTFNERNLIRLYANSHILINQFHSAKITLLKFLENKTLPDRQVQFELLQVYLRLGDIQSAENLITKMLDNTSNDASLIFDISNILYENNNYNLSEKYLSLLVANSDRVIFLRGMLDLKLGNHNEAIAHFDRISNYNYKILAIFNKVSALSEISGSKYAINYLDSMQDQFDSYNDQLRFFLKKISLLREEKKFKEIINICTNYLINEKHDIEVLYSRAMAYESLGNISKMEIDLKEILAIDKENTNTLNALGYSLTIHTKRYNEAYNLVSKAYHNDPGNAAILDSMAWIYYHKGNYKKALLFSEIAYKKDKDPEIIEHFCEILKKNNMHKKLQEIIDFALENYPNKKELVEKLKILKNEIRI